MCRRKVQKGRSEGEEQIEEKCRSEGIRREKMYLRVDGRKSEGEREEVKRREEPRYGKKEGGKAVKEGKN